MTAIQQIPKYSLIIPIYNEEETILELYRRVYEIIEPLDSLTELIFIDDGSKDKSLKLIRELHQQDSRICYLSLGRNFGHQIAVTAGLNFARGQVIVILDADLQDPPELIPKMIEKWQQGYQVVYAQRVKRKQEGWFKRMTAYIFYRLLRRLADTDIPPDTGDFCLMDKQVVEVLNAMPERNRYIRGLRAWSGFNQTAIKFEREPRFAGKVKYSFQKSFSLALNSIISFSRVPLRISTYLGFLSALLAICMTLIVLFWRLTVPTATLTGFTTIIVIFFFLGSVQLICLGILGEYIGRIYEEVKGRPLYTIKEICGFNNSFK